jgi:hypothetical protein
MVPAVSPKKNTDIDAGIFETGAASNPYAACGVPGIVATADYLDSWKEIAAHLNRTVRTVQRWERQEGLPIRRRLHARASSVYASKSEIDIWWNRESVLMERGAPCDGSDNTARKSTKLYNVSIVRSAAKGDRTAVMPSGSKHHDLPELAAIEISVIDKAGSRTPVFRIAVSASDSSRRVRRNGRSDKMRQRPCRLLSLGKNVLTD